MCNHKKYDENCYDCQGRFLTVKRYSHSRPIEFTAKRKPRNGLYFGVELEVECKQCDPEDVLSDIREHITDTWEFKHDGSLTNGFEFESQPKTAGQWVHDTELLHWVKKLPKGCKSHDTTTCGLHIHVNRRSTLSSINGRKSGLTYDDVGKINYFVNMYQEQFEKLGRRPWVNPDGRSYCARTQYLTFDHDDTSKYRAVNIGRQDTLEFRFFKGTLYVPTLRASIMLVNAICEIVPSFTKDEIREGVWDKFLEAIATGNRGKTSKHSYKLHLHAYLNKKGLWSKKLGRMFRGE